MTRRFVVLAAAVVAVVATPGMAAAGTKPVPVEPVPFSYISAGVRAEMVAQQPLTEAASRIQKTIDKGADAGYAGVGLGDGRVVVWWNGELPGAVRDVIGTVRQKTPVEVVAAAHSRAELKSAAKGVASYLRANPKSPYFGVRIPYDGSGLVVNAEPSSGRLGRAAVPAAMAVPAGVQVTVAEGPRMKVTGRLNDTAPFWGGGRIQNNDNNAFCSAGWPVTVGGANYMLTAGHCGRPGGGWNNGNDSVFFGTGALENVDHDVLLISASVGGRMWDGGVGSGEFTKGVAGSDNAFPGEFLCTSASVSGAVCNFRTSDSFQFSFCDDDAYGNFECYSDLVLADQLDGQPGARPGDSGGPVFSLSGTDRVIAKGTITGSGGSTLAFQDFVTAQRDLGISVITG